MWGEFFSFAELKSDEGHSILKNVISLSVTAYRRDGGPYNGPVYFAKFLTTSPSIVNITSLDLCGYVFLTVCPKSPSASRFCEWPRLKQVRLFYQTKDAPKFMSDIYGLDSKPTVFTMSTTPHAIHEIPLLIQPKDAFSRCFSGSTKLKVISVHLALGSKVSWLSLPVSHHFYNYCEEDDDPCPYCS